jgi:gamma-glutamyl:cysteine ligase YbdK (ATP-grasp superfamily)
MNRSAWVNHRRAMREVVMRRWVHRSWVWAHHSRWTAFHSSLTVELLNPAKENMAMMVESAVEILNFIWPHADQVAAIKVIKKISEIFGMRIVNDQPSLRQHGSLTLRARRVSVNRALTL